MILSILLFFCFVKLCFAHSWMAPEDAAKRDNPIPFTTQSIAQGQTLFAELCASCHGIKATGISKEISGLNADTPNLPASLNTHTDGDFQWKILTGKGDMPSFKEKLSEKEIWDIINYIRSLITK